MSDDAGSDEGSNMDAEQPQPSEQDEPLESRENNDAVQEETTHDNNADNDKEQSSDAAENDVTHSPNDDNSDIRQRHREAVDGDSDSDQPIADSPAAAPRAAAKSPEPNRRAVASHEDSDDSSPEDGDHQPAQQRILSSRDNEDERKIFVGGLSWETTVQDVKDYFSKYGTVLDCTLKTDPTTGKSRGFAFVLFEESSSVDKVYDEPIHMLNGRKIDPKKALARGGRDPVRKVFVGGLPPDFPVEDIKEYFGKYGRIVEIEQPFDRQKNQRRAFIFITYESEEIVEQVIANPKQTVGGREVDVRKATPKSDQDASGRGGRGGFSNQRGGPATQGRGGYSGPEGWGSMPMGYPTPPGYPDYYSGYYGAAGYPGYAGYPPGYGYDYSGYYDYSAYYSQQQQAAADWSAYNAAAAQSAAGAAAVAAPPAGYTAPPTAYTQPPYAGYDYSSWYGTDQSGAQTQAATQAGKAKRGSSSTPYHPYSR